MSDKFQRRVGHRRKANADHNKDDGEQRRPDDRLRQRMHQRGTRLGTFGRDEEHRQRHLQHVDNQCNDGNSQRSLAAKQRRQNGHAEEADGWCSGAQASDASFTFVVFEDKHRNKQCNDIPTDQHNGGDRQGSRVGKKFLTRRVGDGNEQHCRQRIVKHELVEARRLNLCERTTLSCNVTQQQNEKN